jgi:hypothetical protein
MTHPPEALRAGKAQNLWISTVSAALKACRAIRF